MEPSSSHLVSLKVMRVSRPAIAAAWEPFYSSSPSFSAHSTSSILSLQGKTPLSGNPKTLRDLTHISELLTLPASFGSIQLGETFSSCLCVNNETETDIEAVSLRVEMQTASSKVLLGEFGGLQEPLRARDTLENIVNHEIKELGQHVLSCTVIYRLPPNSRPVPPPAPGDEQQDPNLQTFRKYYKFMVSNPLSVKTKVHPARSPSATLSLQERDKIFLEVHIQNLTPEALWFEHMKFESVEGWEAVDINTDVFEHCTALMQPQDIRQYVYVLTPKSVELVPPVHSPGATIPLGRLDIAWRSSFGEPGRLLTSMLSRRIHMPPNPSQNPASALPPHLKRPQPTRTHSPSPSQSRPNSPPPYRTRTPTSSISGAAPRPQTPPPRLPPPPPEIDVHLVVRHISRDSIVLGRPFDVSFSIVLVAPHPPSKSHLKRSLTIAVQHIQPPRLVATVSSPTATPLPSSPTPVVSGFSTPKSPELPTNTGIFNYGLAHQKLLTASPTAPSPADDDQNPVSFSAHVLLPPPYAQGPEAEARFARLSGASAYGVSATILPSTELVPSSQDDTPEEAVQPLQAQASQDFVLSWVPRRKGLMPIGGIRILLLEDKFVGDGDEEKIEPVAQKPPLIARVLKELEIVAEVWVSS